MSYQNPSSLSKNISSPSLQGQLSINPSNISNNINNINNINNLNLNNKILNKENNERAIKEEGKSEETDNNDEENEFDEIAEEENEKDEKEKQEEKDEEDALKENQPRQQSCMERLFIYLRTGFVWRPIPKIKTTVLCLEISGVIFVVIGIVIIILSSQIKEIEIRYDDNSQCEIGSYCNINFTVEEDMKDNVFVYYRLKNFYQNHRRYMKSKSNKQLKGEYLTEKDIKDDCDPIKLNKDLYEGIQGIEDDPNSNSTNRTLDPNDVAHPCGLIAKSFFNDSYTIVKNDGEPVIISDKDIAWSIDKKKFKNSDHRYKQWIDVEQERFIVWMRPAALPDFRKTWGKIEDGLKKGKYILTIENNYPVKSFKGKKYFILSTVNALGGRNYLLAILYLVVGGISIVAGILFFFGYRKYNSDTEKTTKKD